jgi:hypothetical protein
MDQEVLEGLFVGVEQAEGSVAGAYDLARSSTQRGQHAQRLVL